MRISDWSSDVCSSDLATFSTPYLARPFEHGADLVYHSATKFLCGHGTVMGGILVDSGAFDWDKSGLFPGLSEPYEGFHDMVRSEERRVGKGWVSTGSSGVWPVHEKTKKRYDNN